MQLNEITQDVLPLYQIEVHHQMRGWYVFTQMPFKTREEAEKHRKLVVDQFSQDKPNREEVEEIVRVVPYDLSRWQGDLIDAVMQDEEATQRALSALSPETLIDVLKW